MSTQADAQGRIWRWVSYGYWHRETGESGPPYGVRERLLPDFSDPATLGCLEQLVMEVEEGNVFIWRNCEGWRVHFAALAIDYDRTNTASYAEALVCVLEGR